MEDKSSPQRKREKIYYGPGQQWLKKRKGYLDPGQQWVRRRKVHYSPGQQWFKEEEGLPQAVGKEEEEGLLQSWPAVGKEEEEEELLQSWPAVTYIWIGGEEVRSYSPEISVK